MARRSCSALYRFTSARIASSLPGCARRVRPCCSLSLSSSLFFFAKRFGCSSLAFCSVFGVSTSLRGAASRSAARRLDGGSPLGRRGCGRRRRRARRHRRPGAAASPSGSGRVAGRVGTPSAAAASRECWTVAFLRVRGGGTPAPWRRRPVARRLGGDADGGLLLLGAELVARRRRRDGGGGSGGGLERPPFYTARGRL